MAKKKTSYAEDRRYRDVRKNQSMDRGSRGTPSKPYLWVTGASVVGILIGFATYYVIQALLNLSLFIKRVAQLHSIQGYVLNWHLPFNRYMWLATFGAAVLGGLIVGYHFYITWKSNNEHLVDTDINFHEDDNYIMFVDEMLETLDWFPDAGAHSSVSPSSLVSHVILTNRGLKKKVNRYKRYDKDGLVDGTMHYKNEIKIENGKRAIETVDIIDKQFGQDLLTDSEIPLDRKDLRKGYRADLINYNPIIDSKRNRRKYREKLNYDTVANLIENDWELPLYEVQRPGGAYLVDTAPVNTMILAITRAGKGELAQLVA